MGSKPNFAPGIPGARVKEVDDVSVTDGKLTWPGAEESEQVKLDEIILVLKPKDPTGRSVIVSLEERPDDSPALCRFSILSTPPTSSPQLAKFGFQEFPPHLKNNNENRVDVIVSTNAGIGGAQEIETSVLRPLWGLAKKVAEDEVSESDQNYHLTVTQNAETVRDFSRTVRSSSGDNRSRTIILLSGDGGVVDLLNGSDETPPEGCEPVISILPLGTGNALFHSSHKPLYSDPGPTPLVLGLRTLFLGQPTPLPAFRASFSPGSRIVTFTDKSKGTDQEDGDLHLTKEETSVSYLDGAIVASYGFHASIVYESDTPEYRVHGDKRFGMVAQELLKESHHYSAKVEIRRSGSSDLEAIPRDTHAYVLTTLVSNLERKFNISPASKPLGRQLHLVHFGPVGGQRAMEVMMKAYDGGKHVGMRWDDGEEVGYEAVDEVRVVALEENERWRKVCIDGTIVEIPNRGYMSVKMLERSPFKVLVDPSVLQN